MPPPEPVTSRGLDRERCCGAKPAVEQRNLAKRVSGSQPSELRSFVTRHAGAGGAGALDEAALARVRPRDADGNVVVGDVSVRAAKDCVLWSDEGPVVVDGVQGLVVVRANGITLVTTVERAQFLKELLQSLPAHMRET